MERVRISEIDDPELKSSVDFRALSDSLGATDVSVNWYRIDPQSRLPWGLHAHYDQEELFLVLDGRLTIDLIDESFDLATGEAIRFEPGEYQAARNAHDSPVTFVAIGAPSGSEDIRTPRPCGTCGHDELRIDLAESRLICPACAEWIPTACAACGAEQRNVVRDVATDRLVDRCHACGDEQVIDR